MSSELPVGIVLTISLVTECRALIGDHDGLIIIAECGLIYYWIDQSKDIDNFLDQLIHQNYWLNERKKK